MLGIYQRQKNGIPKSLNAFTKKENGKGMEIADHRKAKEIRPDQVIPLDEGDFKQF